jgi:toxin ParE1/3/4
MKIIWSLYAHQRVNEIADYIAADSLAAAEKWVISIYDSVKRLEDFPLSGRLVPEIEKNDTREIFFGNYRIIYKVETMQISILTVRHGRQILPTEDIEIKNLES